MSINPGHDLVIVAYDDGFTLPAGPVYQLSSSSSYTASVGSDSTGDSFFFFSVSGPPTTSVDVTQSPGHNYSPLGSSGSFNETPVVVNAAPGYSLGQGYAWTSLGTGSIFSPTGLSVITTIPEPSSVALLGLGTIGLFVIRRRLAS